MSLSKPDDLIEGQSSSPDNLSKDQSKLPENLSEGQPSLSDDLFEEKIFDRNKYITVCKSEMNGIEIGSVIEIENEDKNGYWFATVCSSKGALMNLHYFGDDSDQHTFWLEVKSPRIHSLNWGIENNKKLIPPYPERCSRYKPKVIREKVQDCEHVVPDALLQMEGAPIHNIFKCNMFVEVQDKQYSNRVWISKVLKNVGGRLLLQMQGINIPEEKPFWLFYLIERVFPLGWAEQKGILLKYSFFYYFFYYIIGFVLCSGFPWRVMNLDASLENSTNSSVLLNVLKPKTPEQHSYKIREMLEVINPYSMMVFYVGTIVKIYDNHYFKVEVDNEIDKDKRISFIATKKNPYIFHAGMKLEAVDPLNTDCIRVATVKGFADHWMFLSFDRTSCCQELLRTFVYSDEVFPVGWCNKHNYSLGVPKLPYNDSKDFEQCYYSSDIDIDLSQTDQDNLTKYPDYLKENVTNNSSVMFSKNSYKMCIYFNKYCYPGGHVVKKKILNLPNSIDPGPVSTILREAISLFVDLDCFPWNALKKIKEVQNMLFNGPGGVKMWITTSATRTHSYTESLLLPKSKKMAKKYCSALCNLSGMCEFFMTTEDTNSWLLSERRFK
ncbi:hypothetical protein ACI65C_004901 [Semiaphis heraclei]